MDDKSSEITAIPKLLSVLELTGCIVTIDAMGCQKEIAGTITERGADYVLALKRNQGQLYDDVAGMFEYGQQTDRADSDWFETVEKGHGRVEIRRCTTLWSAHLIAYLNDGAQWSNLRSVAMVESERGVGEVTSVQTRYYISSLSGDAERLLEAVRGHWGVENSVHWVLDVAFREDGSRVRKGNGAEMLASVHRMALNMLKQENTLRVGVAAKRKKAGWETQYLLKVLAQCDAIALVISGHQGGLQSCEVFRTGEEVGGACDSAVLFLGEDSEFAESVRSYEFGHGSQVGARCRALSSR